MSITLNYFFDFTRILSNSKFTFQILSISMLASLLHVTRLILSKMEIGALYKELICHSMKKPKE